MALILPLMPTLIENHAVELKRIERVGFGIQKLHPLLNCTIDDSRLWVGLVRNERACSLHHVLIEAKLFGQGSERSLKPSREGIDLREIEALVVNPFNAQNNTEVAALGQERMLIQKCAHA